MTDENGDLPSSGEAKPYNGLGRDTFGANAFMDPTEPLIANAKRYQVVLPKTTATQDSIQSLNKWKAAKLAEWEKTKKTYSFLDYFQILLPMVGWLRTYKVKQYLVSDLMAGMSVAALVIPQGMSYAKLAGLPSVFGLYGAFVPVLCYAALGSSRHLAVGPVAVTSLLLGSGLPGVVDVPIQDDPNNPADPHAQHVYNVAAIQVAFLAGLLYTAVGLLRLGWLMNFLSHSVINGFMTGASVIIGLSQFKFFMGYTKRPNPAGKGTISFPRNDPVNEQLSDLFGKTWTPYFMWREFVMGMCFLALLLIMKEVGKRSKKLVFVRAIGPLTVCVISIAVSAGMKLSQKPYNIRIVGNIPKGLPHETISWWFPMDNFGRKMGLAILVCAIDVLESISIAKSLAFKNKYELDNTQELRGLGLANIVGSMFSCYTTTGSFSRSAVMDVVGAKTQLAGITGGVLVCFTLLFLTPIFYSMPQNAMAAIIISAVIGLFNYEEWWFLWQVNKLDWVVFNVAMLGTMFAGVDMGLGISIGVSLLLALYKYAFPHTAVLGLLPGTGGVYRNVKQYEDAKQVDGLLVVRIDAPLFFANVPKVKEDLFHYEKRALESHAARGSTLKFIIVDLSPVTDIDASAVHFLHSWVTQLKARGITPVFANPSRRVSRLIVDGKLNTLIGEENIVVRTGDAVEICKLRLAEDGGPAKHAALKVVEDYV